MPLDRKIKLSAKLKFYFVRMKIVRHLKDIQVSHNPKLINTKLVFKALKYISKCKIGYMYTC